jgi:hypothetical protein
MKTMGKEKLYDMDQKAVFAGLAMQALIAKSDFVHVNRAKIAQEAWAIAGEMMAGRDGPPEVYLVRAYGSGDVQCVCRKQTVAEERLAEDKDAYYIDVWPTDGTDPEREVG